MSNATPEFRPQDVAIRGNALHIGGSAYALASISSVNLVEVNTKRNLARWLKITLMSVMFTVALAGLMETARRHLESALLSVIGITATFMFYPFLLISAGLVLASIIMLIAYGLGNERGGPSALLTIVFSNGSRRGTRGEPAELEALKAAIEQAMSQA